MRYEYVVILKRNSERTIDVISFLLCSLSALDLLYAQSLSHQFNWPVTTLAIIVLAGAIVNVFTTRRQSGNRPIRYRLLLMLAAVGWLTMNSFQWLSVLFVLMAFLEYQAKRPLEIGFSPNKVVVNSLFRKQFGWSAFNNIMLKDGLLTLDFKNNRLLQKEVDEEEEGEADEDEFNAYCRDQLRLADQAITGGG